MVISFEAVSLSRQFSPLNILSGPITERNTICIDKSKICLCDYAMQDINMHVSGCYYYANIKLSLSIALIPALFSTLLTSIKYYTMTQTITAVDLTWKIWLEILAALWKSHAIMVRSAESRLTASVLVRNSFPSVRKSISNVCCTAAL